jgi:hypothetical protein
MINNSLIDIVLTLSPPKSTTHFTECTQLSRAIGDVAMISILSAQKIISSMFRLVHIFGVEIWTGILIFYFVLSIISFMLCNDFCIFIDYLAIALRQNLVKFERKQKTSTMTLMLFWFSFIFSSVFSGILLTFLVFPTPFDPI